MARTWSRIAPALLAALPWLEGGCSQVVCGTGTIERDGVCEPSDVRPDDAQCGEGTELGPGGKCVPSEPTVCDPDTTEPQYDPDTNVTTCFGSGGGCSAELPCMAPSAGKLTLCGRLYDTETDQVIAAPGATGAPCNPAAPTADGPCSLSVKFYDALVFQMDPQNATPLVPASLLVDDCGRYQVRDLPETSFGFVGAGVDDAMGQTDRHHLTGVATADAQAKPARGFRLYATRKTTEQAWTTAGTPAGGAFATQGVLAMVYRHRGMPVAGVSARRGGNVIPSDDFYFTDAAATRTTVDRTPTMTGANGTALVINSASPAPHDGVGGEPAGCRWPSALAATIPGVVFVQLKDAESTTGGPCP